MRTDLTSEIDATLSTRNAGSRGFHEVARSGNGNMRTDLMQEDGKDFEETEAGESVEEMTLAESAAEDQGDRTKFRPYREAKEGEVPPHAPKPGMAWMRRRIRMNSRRPGGNRLVRARWCMVSPLKYSFLQKTGQVTDTAYGNDMGFVDISSKNLIFATVGALVGVGLYMAMRKRN